MKKYLIILPAIALLYACGGNCKEKCTKEKDSPKELEAIMIKLEATEAQLLNVSAELSKCKAGKNDIESKEAEEIEIEN